MLHDILTALGWLGIGLLCFVGFVLAISLPVLVGHGIGKLLKFRNSEDGIWLAAAIMVFSFMVFMAHDENSHVQVCENKKIVELGACYSSKSGHYCTVRFEDGSKGDVPDPLLGDLVKICHTEKKQ